METRCGCRETLGDGYELGIKVRSQASLCNHYSAGNFLLNIKTCGSGA